MANDYYTKSGVPATQAPLSSSAIRAEFSLIEQGFDKLPSFSGKGGKPVKVNADEDGLEAGDIGAENIGNTPAGNIAATTVQAAINELDTEKAPLASPTFTGTPAAPTAADGTNTTQIATTAFVQAAIALLKNGVSAAFDTLSEIATELGFKAPLASPTFTGTPAAPTAAVDTSTTQLATTAFVTNQAASTTPLADTASGSVGTSKRYARADHTHPMSVKQSFLASGTISAAGLPVSLLSNGRVAAIGGALSTKVAFVSSAVVVGSVSACYDPTTQKVVVFYAVNTTYYAVVGTVSGGSITFGTPVSLGTVSGQLVSRCAIEAGSGKVVVMYRSSSTNVSIRVGTILGTSISFGSSTTVTAEAVDGRPFDICYCATSGKFVYVRSRGAASNYARAAVGTVSGTNISFGTEADIHATATYSRYICCTYDSTNDKIVAFYIRSEVLYAAVGTVSGTTISFGTEVTCYSGRGYYLDAAFDANAGKTVTTFVNTASDSRGRAIVGTVSGTSISFGTAAEFTANAVDGTSIAYDSTNHKLILSYGYADSPQYIKAVTGTISGTDITFGTAVNVTDSGYSGATHAIVYDSDTNSAVVAYRELSNYGYGRVASLASGDISYALMNFIGISEASAADGAALDVTIIGGVNSSVSGLTTGADYYVDSAGALTLSSTNNDLVGKALSATSILVTGGTP
jgi:hypothetical protein